MLNIMFNNLPFFVYFLVGHSHLARTWKDSDKKVRYMKKIQKNRGTVSLCAAAIVMGLLFMKTTPPATHAILSEAPSTAYVATADTPSEETQPQEAPASEESAAPTAEPAVTESTTHVETPVDSTAKPNSIGFGGVYFPFLDMGPSTTANVQTVIDAGYVAASTTFFSPTDGNTTYFSGHNPGIFSYFAMDFEVGGVVTVIDDDGSEHLYTLVERVVMEDTKDVGVQNQFTGLSAGEIYTYGSGQESIAIQFCQGTTMYQWYAVKQ